jgi:predicted ATPase/class 3 adenylate cyclase/DNA-binding CsgD family transcriptional regulator
MADDEVRGMPQLLWADPVSGPPSSGFLLPTGTVTFLLTDVEGSSRRWERAPDAMAAAIARHYELLEEATTAHGGVRPVEQGEGDSVVGAFSRASDALAAALEAQRRLQSEPWPKEAELRVRMAVHTGEAQLRDEGNYFGRTVIRCARLRAIGHGAQVLVSDATAALVADRLPPETGLVELGVHRLKDLGRPERVWQLVHPDIETSFPPLRSMDAFRHNLPAQLTPLIGREHEIGEVRAVLGAERLVTLTGSGGVGKTRLALAVAAEAIEQYAGGVFLVELAGVTDPAGVAGAARAAIGAQQAGATTPGGQLAEGLGDDPSLVLFDNCEHLVSGVAALINDLLTASSTVSVVATSREPLQVPGEIVWRVPCLDSPGPDTTLAVAALSQYDAVKLFVDRARRARPSFTVSDENAPAVAQICHRLDGIPLALELAAARCRQLTPERILRDLDDRFRLLTGGTRTVLPRQQTLAASIGWSHDRLDPAEQLVFRRLGVFAGVFPLEAAEWVASAPGGVETVEVFDVVSRLVDKSLVQVSDARDGEPRYRLLETLRAFAVARAREAGELDRLRGSHADWWLAWLESRADLLHTDAAVDLVEEFHDNFGAALDASSEDPSRGLRLLWRLGRPWQGLERHADAMAAVDRFLTPENADRYPTEWMRAATSVGVLVMTARGYGAARSLLEKAETLATEAGDAFHLTVARWLSGFTPELCAELRDVARQNGQRYAEALAIIVSAQLTVDGEPAIGLALVDTPEAVAAASESSYLTQADLQVRGLAFLSTAQLARCLAVGREMSASRSLGMVNTGVRLMFAAAFLSADAASLASAIDVAEHRLRKTPRTAATADAAQHSLRLLRGEAAKVPEDLRPDNLGLMTLELYMYAREAIDAGNGEIATSTVSAVGRPHPHGKAVAAAIHAAAGGDVGEWHEALALAIDHGLLLIAADAIDGLAVAAAEAESWAECLRLTTAGAQLRDETGYRWRFGIEQRRLDAAVALAQERLGPELTSAAEAEGHALPWRDLAAYAQRARGERKRPRHGWDSLTPTEVQVLALVAEGLTNPQIADRLLMGRATVKTHIEHIFAKIGVSSRSELAARAVRRERS